MILVFWMVPPFLALIVAGVLQEKGYFRTPGAVVFAAMVATVGYALPTMPSLLLGPGGFALADLLQWQLTAAGGMLSALLAGVAMYGAKRGWLRRGLFAVAAACLLATAVFGQGLFLFGGLWFFPVLLLVYVVMAVTNPPLRASEARASGAVH